MPDGGSNPVEHAKHTDDRHLCASKTGAVGGGDKDLGELHRAEIVSPAAEEGEREEEEKEEGCEGIGG